MNGEIEKGKEKDVARLFVVMANLRKGIDKYLDKYFSDYLKAKKLELDPDMILAIKEGIKVAIAREVVSKYYLWLAFLDKEGTAGDHGSQYK